MAYNFGNLSVYTEQNRLPLITKAIFDARSAKYFTPQVGIKSSAALNLMDTTLTLQSGGACGYSSSGTTTLSNRVLNVGRMKTQETLCPRELEQYWIQTQLLAGSNAGDESIPFEQQFAELKVKKIAAAMETAIWSGNAYFSGIISLLTAADLTGSVVSANTANVATLTSGNIIGIFNTIYEAVPAAIIGRDNLVAFCGWDTFRTLCNAVVDKNYFNWYQDPNALANGEVLFPGTTMKVVAVNGLNGNIASKRHIVATHTSNLFYGTDLLSDEEQFNIWYSKDNDEVRTQAAWKAGVQVAYGDEIVRWTQA